MTDMIIGSETYNLDELRREYMVPGTKMPAALAQKILDEQRRNFLGLGYHTNFGWFLLGLGGDNQFELLWAEMEWKHLPPEWHDWPTETGYYWMKSARTSRPHLIKVHQFTSPEEHDFNYGYFGMEDVYFGADLDKDDDIYSFYGPIEEPPNANV